jgi:phytoene dehydrogenase-like protein
LTGGRSDDGRAYVPSGIARPVERVVVVGAGIAGLTVANALALGRIGCVVVEALTRIGGRLHTVDLGGSAVDLGGSWIHHPIGNPVRVFAKRNDYSAGSPSPSGASLTDPARHI